MSNSFVTIGDSNYFPSIGLSVLQAERFHPNAIFGIYDWGFTDREKHFLLSRPNVRLVEWKDRFVTTPFSDSYRKALSRLVRTTRVLATRKFQGGATGLRRHYKNVRQILRNLVSPREWLYAQKPYCIYDWAQQPEVEKFLFLDGDAFLVNSIPELLDARFDLGVTVRRRNEIRFEKGYCQVINSGVIAFTGRAETNRAVVRAWIENMSVINEYLIEQTALTRLVFGDEGNDPIEYGQLRQLKVDTKHIGVKLLSCDAYNFNWIEEGIDPNRNKIVHFKGGRHAESRFLELVDALRLQEQVKEVMRVRG